MALHAHVGNASFDEHYRNKLGRNEPARLSEVLSCPADDGFSWRKYGQRDIPFKYPIGCFRCTYRNTHGCGATKQVQRTDGDPSLFNVAYLGEHTCRDNAHSDSQGSSRHAASSDKQEPSTTTYDRPDHTQHRDSALMMQPNLSTVVYRQVVNPLDDGFKWRKYGKKDLFGHTYPRSYFRCVYRNTHGCTATKKVQRTNGDPSLFSVEYHGKHTCGLSSDSNIQLRWSQSAASSEHSQDKLSSTITSTHSESVDGEDFCSAANFASVVSSQDNQTSTITLTHSKGLDGQDFASAANLASAESSQTQRSSTVTSTQSETEGVGENFASPANFASVESDEDKWVKKFAILFPSADVFNWYD
ncbi:hypothetical protein ABZP36_009765 [Zizania latifolia]